MSTTLDKPKKPGEARFPGPSTRDLILSDGWETPEVLTTETYEYLGSEDIDYAYYTSQDIFDAEMEKVWPKVWQWACREEHIPEPGDYYVYDIGDYSILIARTKSGDIKAYHNACMHRGTQLKPSDSHGQSENFRCPYHGWVWSLEGDLEDLPCEWDFPHVDREAFSLPEVHVGRWGGFIFINMDDDPMPLEDYVATLRLTPVTEGDRSFAEWSAEFSCDPSDEGDLVNGIGSDVFQVGFDALKRHFGGGA